MLLRAISLVVLPAALVASAAPAQVRARELGIKPGIFQPGPLNAITDVIGVRVGHTTIIEGDSVRTGITTIFPHGGNPFLQRAPAAIVVGNGFGKLLGSTQVDELGELESPILLTCTLCVWRVADATVAWMIRQPGMEEVRSLNPVVAETNDGYLNDIRRRPVTPGQVEAALAGATGGPVAEGSVGAGTGTIAFSWKGGIGTSSRVVPSRLGGWTVGVLVQSNFGGVFQVLGAPVGKELGRYAFRSDIEAERGDGSIIIVVATDAPILDRNLRRLGVRALMGLARTGSSASNGSGDYVIAFSSAAQVQRPMGERRPAAAELENEEMSALFQAVVEATEEAIYNSLFMATPIQGARGKIDPIPLDRVREILRKYAVNGR
jgi:D-aminopeptidase